MDSTIIYEISHTHSARFEMIIIINTMDIDKSIFETMIKENENIKVLRVNADITLGECLNIGIEESKGDILARFDDDAFYSPYYLIDAHHAMIYANADVVGKTRAGRSACRGFNCSTWWS